MYIFASAVPLYQALEANSSKIDQYLDVRK